MSKGAKIALVIGILAVAGGVGYYLYKAKKEKDKKTQLGLEKFCNDDQREQTAPDPTSDH